MDYRSAILEHNPIALTIIENAFNEDKVSHAYLFSAPKEYFIEIEPLYLIQKIIGINTNPLLYPDLIIIDGQNKSILKDEIARALNQLQQTPLSDLAKKILFIKNVEGAAYSAMSSLLKFIEEPTNDTYVVMTTNDIKSVIQTIRSRSQTITLRALSKKSFVSDLERKGIGKQEAIILSAISSSPEAAFQLHVDNKIYPLIDNIVTILEIAFNQPFRLISDLISLSNKENIREILMILNVFFNDVWRHSFEKEIVFQKYSKVISRYQEKKFDFATALNLIDTFLNHLDNNINFEVTQGNFFIKLEELMN